MYDCVSLVKALFGATVPRLFILVPPNVGNVLVRNKGFQKSVVPNNFPLFRGKCQRGKDRAAGDGKRGPKT